MIDAGVALGISTEFSSSPPGSYVEEHHLEIGKIDDPLNHGLLVSTSRVRFQYSSPPWQEGMNRSGSRYPISRLTSLLM